MTTMEEYRRQILDLLAGATPTMLLDRRKMIEYRERVLETLENLKAQAADDKLHARLQTRVYCWLTDAIEAIKKLEVPE